MFPNLDSSGVEQLVGQIAHVIVVGEYRHELAARGQTRPAHLIQHLGSDYSRLKSRTRYLSQCELHPCR